MRFCWPWATPALLLAVSLYASDDAPHWGYGGDVGPDNWASLSESYATCASGMQQSPIDLRRSQPVKRADLVREYRDQVLTVASRAQTLDLVDNGHTIQITSDGERAMTLGDATYTMVQMHFHAPSEHTLEGKHWPLEAHLVMSTDDGSLAVLGVFYSEGAHDPAFDAIVAALPDAEGDKRHLRDVHPDLEDVGPLGDRYFRYSGSLTTPPCTEGVTWVLMTQAIELSGEQLGEFASRLNGNARPTQPLGARELLLVAP